MTTIDVKFGQIAVLATDGNHIYATSNPESGRNFLPFTIRGVDYHVSAHLNREGNRWIVDQKYFWMSRRDWTKADNVSVSARRAARAARRAAHEVIESAVNAWAKSNADTIRRAEIAALDNQIERKTNEMTEKLQEVAALQAEILELQKQRDSK